MSPYNVTRREMNCNIGAAVKANQTFKRKLWESRNKNKPRFKIATGDLALIKNKLQNKSLPIFGSDIFRCVRPMPFSAVLCRTSDNLTLVRHCSEIKVIHRFNQHAKIPADILSRFDLADYSQNTLVSQAKHIETEGVRTRSQTPAAEVVDIFGEVENYDDYDYDEDDEKEVTFNDDIEVREIPPRVGRDGRRP